MNTRIYSIFPACGKTWLYEHQEDYDLKILDSDSSQFSWQYVADGNGGFRKERNPDFPNNYITHIKAHIGKVDYIFVSTHEEVRKALAEAGIDFTVVFPRQSLKAEWVGRCFLRGSGEAFCKLIADNWDDRIYAYERDAPGNFTNLSLYGSGVWASAYMSYKLIRNFRHKFYLKFLIISQPVKTSVRFQYSISF